MTLDEAIATIHRCELNDARYVAFELFSEALRNAAKDLLRPRGDFKGRTVCAAYFLGAYEQNDVGVTGAVYAYWEQHARPEPQPEWVVADMNEVNTDNLVDHIESAKDCELVICRNDPHGHAPRERLRISPHWRGRRMVLCYETCTAGPA